MGLPLLYGSMILVTPIYGGNLNEIYPFFRWSLFSKTPEWTKTMLGVQVVREGGGRFRFHRAISGT